MRTPVLAALTLAALLAAACTDPAPTQAPTPTVDVVGTVTTQVYATLFPPTPTPTATPTSTPTPTATATPTPTPTATATPTPTATPTLTPTPTLAPPYTTIEDLLGNLALPPDPPYGVDELLRLADSDPRSAYRIQQLPWVAEGFEDDPAAREGVAALTEAARFYGAVFDALMEQPWVQDDMTWTEALSLGDLRQVAQHDLEAALSIIEMPFLETHDGGMDRAALNSLGWVAQDKDIQEVLTHPALADGITDEQADLVAMLDKAHNVADAMDELLDEQTVVVRRMVSMPLQDDIALSVIWPGESATIADATRTMDYLASMIPWYEDFMDIPYPLPYGTILIADYADYAGGTRLTSHATIHPGYGIAADLIAQRFADMYWTVSPYWLALAAADVMQILYVEDQFGSGLALLSEKWSHSTCNSPITATVATDDLSCSRERTALMFMDLRSAMGHQAFTRAFGRLSTWLNDHALRVRCGRDSPDYVPCYLHAAFIEYEPLYAVETAAIINWYYNGVQDDAQ